MNQTANSENNLEVCLNRLGFTPLEAKIYLALLNSDGLSAYQLAKKINISRSSIYNAIEHMADKGIILYSQDKTPVYLPKDPLLLLKKMNRDWEENITDAKVLLQSYTAAKTGHRSLIIRGKDEILFRAKEILENAQNDIYINADFDLDLFAEEFDRLIQRNIKIIVFSFFDIQRGNERVDFYSHGRKLTASHVPSRFMLAEHDNISLIAGRISAFSPWSGELSTHPTSIALVSEHIHNDIYLLKLREIHGQEMYQNIRIQSEFEALEKISKEENPEVTQ